MKTLPRALSSEEEALAMRYADECARTLLAYYREDDDDSGSFNQWRERCDRAWCEHKAAVERYENAFPKLDDWEKFAEPDLMRAVEEARP